MEIAPGFVLCPACSGVGYRMLSDQDPKPECSLCQGYGDVPEERAEEFWACVTEALAARHGVHLSCVKRVWT